MIEFYKVNLPDRIYGYYAGYTQQAVVQRAYSDINNSTTLKFEKVEKTEIPNNETIHNCGLSFEDARSI